MRARIRSGVAVAAGATIVIGLLASIASAGANVAIADGPLTVERDELRAGAAGFLDAR